MEWVKHTETGLWSSGNLALWSDQSQFSLMGGSGFGARYLSDCKVWLRHFGQCCASRYVDRFEEGPFLFQHVWAPGHKASSVKTWLDEFGVEEHRALISTQSNTSGMNWNGDWEPGLLVQHQSLISQILYWMNEQNFYRNTPKSCGEPVGVKVRSPNLPH